MQGPAHNTLFRLWAPAIGCDLKAQGGRAVPPEVSLALLGARWSLAAFLLSSPLKLLITGAPFPPRWMRSLFSPVVNLQDVAAAAAM